MLQPIVCSSCRVWVPIRVNRRRIGVVPEHRVLEDDHVVFGQQCLLGAGVDLEVGVGGVQVVHGDMGQVADGVHQGLVGLRLGQVGVTYDKENLGHDAEPFQ
jgi:hypothetical protein